MEAKKTERASLEEKKNIYFLIGLVLVLALVWYAFELKSWDREEEVVSMAKTNNVEEDVVLQTEREEPIQQEQPQPQVTQIQIVDDDVEIDDDFEINAEADENAEIKDQVVGTKEVEEEKEEEVFVFVEEQPSYPGGDEARQKYLRDNTKYPAIAMEGNIQGTVYVTFVVEKDGSVSNVKVLRGIGGGCDEEAMRVIKNMPKWAPGKQRGRAVRAQFNMPIKFTLSGGN